MGAHVVIIRAVFDNYLVCKRNVIVNSIFNFFYFNVRKNYKKNLHQKTFHQDFYQNKVVIHD